MNIVDKKIEQISSDHNYADSFDTEQTKVIHKVVKKCLIDLCVFIDDGHDLGNHANEIVNDFLKDD